MNGQVHDERATDLEATRAQLTRTVSLLEASLNATADGLLVIASDGSVSAHNERFLALWRIPEEIAKSNDDAALLAFVVEQVVDPTEFLQGVQALYRTPEAESVDVIRFKDGRVFERYSRPQRVGHEIVGRVWSFRDVTEREQLLERAEFLALAGRLLASLDVERAIEAAMRIAIPYLGDVGAIDLLVDENCVPSEPRRLVDVGDRPLPALRVALARELMDRKPRVDTTQSPVVMAAPLLVHAGVKGVLRFGGARRYGEHDLEVLQAFAASIALSLENAWLYRGAKSALASREEFLCVAAHELRGPVTSIHLAAQSLRRGNAPPEKNTKLLEVIEREDGRIARFVDELVELTRIRAGHLTFSFERVDVAAVVREVAARAAPELARAGSRLVLDVAPRSVGAWDRARIDQVVTNLLSNAIKFGRGKPITIRLEECAETIVLTVADHGVGIAPELEQKLFQPFERAVSSRHYGGLGLGLYIVRTIVEGLGGSVRLESKSGEGTRVIVELPRTRGD